MLNLDTKIEYLKGVGPKRAEILNKEIGVYTVEDLLFYFPYKYTDRSKFIRIGDIKSDNENVQINGRFRNFAENKYGKKKLLQAEFYDETGRIKVTWFQRIKWVRESINTSKQYVIYGKPKLYNGLFSMVHPETELVEKRKAAIQSLFNAEYSSTEKMKKFYLNSKTIRNFIHTIFKQSLVVEENLPAYLLEKMNLLSLKDAMLNIHFPQTYDKMKAATYRFKFEELFFNQLSILKQKKYRTNTTAGFIMKRVGDNFMNFYNNNLKFELTNAQKRVLKEIRADFMSGKQCNRLLQGDVGSGKTVIALMSMLIALDNGFQACIMVPTEILAQQHFSSIVEMLRGLDINVKLLTGSTKIKERRLIDDELQSGELSILIGTHALIEDSVVFKNLGLAVIDEQHRFGVAQRAKMWKKNIKPPHVVVMTATPIPRTLSMTLYGDLEVSMIDELPAGRKPIKTYHYRENKRVELYNFIRKQIEKGRQIYVVYPLITESEVLDYKNLEDGYQDICNYFKSSNYGISMVHGKMKPDDKQNQMELFVDGKTDILVGTTVIEVGVNVPNASVMVIESAEKFGLSQLHQLRGRVGRGNEQSFCILMTSNKLSAEARLRLKTMVATTDGFKISEADLRLRGPGDVFGKQQSGVPMNFRIANIVTDVTILQNARNVAKKIIMLDPELKNENNKKLDVAVKKYIKSSYGMIS